MKITLSGTQYDVSIKLQHYKNGRLRIDLIDKADAMPVAVATVNMPDLPCEIGHCWIKDYSENTGITKQLEELGVISESIKTLDMDHCGYVNYCKFLNSHN